MRRSFTALVLALCSGLLLVGCGSSDSPGGAEAASEQWSFTDGSGKTVRAGSAAAADHRPCLLGGGADGVRDQARRDLCRRARSTDDVGLENVDFEGVEIIGEEWGKIDVEKAAALDPDLIVADYWPVEKGYSGMENGVEEKSKKIAELAPVVGPAQGDSIVDLIEGYEKLAAALGADVSSGRRRGGEGELRGGARMRSRRRPRRSRASTCSRSARTTTSTPSPCPKHAPELLDFQALGARRDRPREARSGLPVLADPELRERRHVPARPAALRRPQLPGKPEHARSSSRSPRASRRSRPTPTRRGRRTGCTPTPTTRSSSSS